MPQGVQAVQLDNTIKFAVDDSGALPGAKPGPPAVPPRDDDEAEIIAEETVEPTEMQRMPPDTYAPTERHYLLY